MPGSPERQGRLAAACLGLMLALAAASCTESDPTPGDGPSRAPEDGRAGATSGAAAAVCVVGRPTGEGVECQAFRADAGNLYTLIGDLGGLAGEACVCGQPVELSTCMQGTTIAVTRIGPPATCP
jgi:hypothetical protein